jgi:hypothetical protein
MDINLNLIWIAFETENPNHFFEKDEKELKQLIKPMNEKAKLALLPILAELVFQIDLMSSGLPLGWCEMMLERIDGLEKELKQPVEKEED